MATTSVFGHAYGGSAPENYERHFVPLIGAPFAADLVADAALNPGERVLDVACGTGVVARLAAERVGPHGTVAAVDLNPAMLAVASASASELASRRNQFAQSVDRGFCADLAISALESASSCSSRTPERARSEMRSRSAKATCWRRSRV